MVSVTPPREMTSQNAPGRDGARRTPVEGHGAAGSFAFPSNPTHCASMPSVVPAKSMGRRMAWFGSATRTRTALLCPKDPVSNDLAGGRIMPCDAGAVLSGAVTNASALAGCSAASSPSGSLIRCAANSTPIGTTTATALRA